MTLIEVQQDGQKTRLFRFDDQKITIGFPPQSLLALDPADAQGPQLLLAVADGAITAKPVAQPGAFQVNQKACTQEVSLKPGDPITVGRYRIAIRDGKPAAPSPAPAPAPQPPATVAGGASAPAAAEPAKAPEPPKKPAAKSGMSYIYLFFGPIQQYLADDDVSEVMINGPHQIYIERKGKVALIPEKFANEQALQAAVINVARSVGRFFNTENPRLDARLPDGSRVHAVMPPLSRAGTVVAIRKFRKERLTMDKLIQFGSITPEGAKLLETIVRLGRNIIVSGATSSGKTSVLNVLSAAIPAHDRILVLEDASELQLQQEHVVGFETRKADEHGKGEVTIRDLVHSALRLRPDRIVVGEIRGGEALDMLQAMNTGHDGCMSTIHANTARDALFRLETCAMLSGVELPLSALREQVGSAIHVVVQTARLFDGSRRITAVSEVLGLRDGEYQIKDIFVFQQEGIAADGRITGKHVFTGYQPAFIEKARRYGFDLSGLFPAAAQ